MCSVKVAGSNVREEESLKVSIEKYIRTTGGTDRNITHGNIGNDNRIYRWKLSTVLCRSSRGLALAPLRYRNWNRNVMGLNVRA